MTIPTYPLENLGPRNAWFRARTGDSSGGYSGPFDNSMQFLTAGDSYPDYRTYGCYEDDLMFLIVAFKNGTYPSSGPPIPYPHFMQVPRIDSTGYRVIIGTNEILEEYPELTKWNLLCWSDAGNGKPKIVVWFRRVVSFEVSSLIGWRIPATGANAATLWNDRFFCLQAGSFKPDAPFRVSTTSGQGRQINLPGHFSIDTRSWATQQTKSPINLQDPKVYTGTNVSIALAAKNSESWLETGFAPIATSVVGSTVQGDGWFVAQIGEILFAAAHCARSDGGNVGGIGVNFEAQSGDNTNGSRTFPWASCSFQVAANTDRILPQSNADPYSFKENFTNPNSLDRFLIRGIHGKPPGEVTII